MDFADSKSISGSQRSTLLEVCYYTPVCAYIKSCDSIEY